MNRLLDLLIVFLLCYAVLSVLLPDYAWASGAVALVIVLVYSKRRRAQVDVVGLIEEAYPALRERLSAAYDNCGKESTARHGVVLRSLAQQVSCELGDVRASTFFQMGAFLKRVLLVVLLCFVVVSLVFVNLSAPVSLERWKDVSLGVDGVVDPSSLTRLLEGGERDIFGSPEVAVLSGDETTLTLYRGVGSELNLRELDEMPPAFESAPLFPSGEEPAPLYAEEPIKHREIVKKYFIKLSESDIQ